MRQGSDTRDFCIKKIVAPLVVLFITFLVYYPTLIYGFVFDDLPTIINYIHARTLDIRSTFFSNSRWVSRLLNQYTYVNWGENPFAYRIFDVLLHIVNGLMVFALLLFLLSKFKKNEFIQRNTYPISLLTMILFLLHPVQTQTVTYITQIRLEGLVAFFIFATLLTFVYSVYNTKSIARYLLLMLSFILAAFGSGTKEIIVGLPFVVAVVDWFFISQGEWSEFKNRIWIHLTLASIVWGFLFLYGNITPRNVINIITNPVCNNRGNILTPSSKEPITIYYYMISQFKVILHYFLIFFFPFGLSFDYGYVLSRSFYGIDVLLPLAVLISLGFVIFRRWLSDATDIIVFCFLWFLILMLPRTSIFISTELVCDYKTYAASFGMMLLLAYLIIYAVSSAIVYSNTLLDHRFEVAGSILFVCALCYATVIRNNVWSSDLLFWKDAMEKSDKARCYHNYATALYEKGDINGAIQYFTKAIEKDDFYGEPHVNLALIYQNRGNYVTAMEHYKRALEIGEGHPQLFNNLGLLHFTTNSIDKAECCFKQAIVLCPYDSRALYNLGNVLAGRGSL